MMIFAIFYALPWTLLALYLAPNGTFIRDEARRAFFQSLVDHAENVADSPQTFPHGQGNVFAKSSPDLTDYPINQTLYIIADLHGDFLAAITLLYAGGLIDRNGAWTGGDALVVQLGDIADRGPDSPAIYELFWRLKAEAQTSGGNIFQIFGNHEVMNLMSQTHYISTRELRKYYNGTFKQANDIWNPLTGSLGSRILSSFRASQTIGDLKFVHAGLLAEFATLEPTALDDQLRSAIRAFASGDTERYNQLRNIVEGLKSPVWTRELTHSKNEKSKCRMIAAAHNKTKILRQFVGHTPTTSHRVETYCNNTFIQADTGISRWMFDSQTMIRVQTSWSSKTREGINIFTRSFDEYYIVQMPYVTLPDSSKAESPDKPLTMQMQTLFSDEVCYQGATQINCSNRTNKNDEL